MKTIQEFVQNEVIYCVSSMVYQLTQSECYRESDEILELWQGSIDWDAVES